MTRKKKNNNLTGKSEAPEIEVTESVVEEIVETEEPVVEEVAVEEEPVIEEVEEVVEEPVIEEVEEVVEEIVEPTPAPVVEEKPAPTTSASPDHTMDGWWIEIGSRMNKRGYGRNTIVRRAKVAFGSDFDESKYKSYCDSLENKNLEIIVKGVWLSQK